MVIEIADSSLSFDEGAKLRLYAAAAIPVYLIVDIPGDRVRVHREPEASAASYRVRRDHRRGEAFDLPLRGESLVMLVDDLLPR